MPAPRTQRVPDAFAREVFRMLNREGRLAVILGVLWDHHDFKRQEIDNMLERELITDATKLAELQKRQGALAEIAKIAKRFDELGQAETVAAVPPLGREPRPVDPVRVSSRKRAGARF